MTDIRGERLTDLADMVAYLPAGCAFWRSVGGPNSLSEEAHLLRSAIYELQLLKWMQSKDGQEKRNQPKPPQPIPFAGEAKAEEAHATRQLAARKRRERASEA